MPSPGGTLSGARPRFFQPSMTMRELPGRPALLVEVVGRDHLLQQADLIVGVEDGEIGRRPDELRVPAQHLGGDGMEGAEPGHAFGDLAEQQPDAMSFISRAALLVKVTARICEG